MTTCAIRSIAAAVRDASVPSTDELAIEDVIDTNGKHCTLGNKIGIVQVSPEWSTLQGSCLLSEQVFQGVHSPRAGRVAEHLEEERRKDPRGLGVGLGAKAAQPVSFVENFDDTALFGAGWVWHLQSVDVIAIESWHSCCD